MLDKDSDEKEEEEDDMSIEEVINRAARIEEEKKSLKELITSTTIKQLTASPRPSTTNKTPRSLLPQLPEFPVRE